MISRFAVRTFATVLMTFAAGIQAMHGQAVPQLLPYQTSVVAGGGTTALTAGATCPVSGNTSTDNYGDGCLATEVQLNAPKYVTEDAAGNIYFSDYGNKLIRRVDAASGIITAVAGGGSLAAPSSTVSDTGQACPSTPSVQASDFQGDSCLATDVQLVQPTGVAIAPVTGGLVTAGDIIFADAGTYTVRGINSQGQIYNVAGDARGTYRTYGYIANNPTTTPTPTYINAATQGALDSPYGIHFDSTGNLYIAEEYKDAILVVNTSSATTTVTGISIPAGTIAKIAGYPKTGGGAFCPNGTYPSTASTYGCYGNPWPNNTAASLSPVYYPYDVTTDPWGNVYTINESTAAVGQISNTTFNLNTYAGTQTTVAVTNQRGVATSVPFGTPYGIAADSYGNIYIPDSYTGWIWRVDATGQLMYVLAGAGTGCILPNGLQSDTYGDGCIASQSKFPTGSITAGKLYASSPGISGLFVDAYGTLLVGDTFGNMVHQITTNANFGKIQNTSPVQTIQIHFGAGDSGSLPSGYVLTTNPSNFILGAPNCTTNSDNTSDCLVAVEANTAIATASGPFSSNLQVTSQYGMVNNFTLSGNLNLSQINSTTALTFSTTNANPVTPVTITATVLPLASASSGSVTFYSGGNQIGTTQVANGTASMQYKFPVGTYQITAVYSGNPNLYTSTSTATTVNSMTPVFNLSPTSTSMTVAQGQTALNSIKITTVGSYTGTVSFACSGLPANTTCSFSPASLAVGQAGVAYNTVTVNILTGATTNASLAKPANPGAGRRLLPLYCMLPGFAGIVFFGVGRKKRIPAVLLLMGTLLLAFGFSGCAGNQAKTTPTPTGTYAVTITATGTPNVVSPSANVVQTSTLSLTVTGY